MVFFFVMSTGSTVQPILTLDGSNDGVWLKEAPFGV
jgi:hypothetical protein